MKIFSQRLKELRKDMEQTQLAKILNTTNKTISAWETNRAEPSMEMIVKIAKHFNTSADYLLGLSDNMYTNI